MAKLLPRCARPTGLIVAAVLLLGLVAACAGPSGPPGLPGPAGPAGPAGAAGPPGASGRSAPEAGPALSASIAGGKLTIAGSGFPPGEGVWLNIPGAADQGRDVFLTKDLAIVNESGAFAVTLDMSKPPLGGKGALKPGVYSVKSVGGDVVATAPLIIPAPAKAPAATPPAKAPASTPPAKAPAAGTPPAPISAQGVTRFNASYGSVPETGWKWAVGEIRTEAQERIEEPEEHSFAWIFYVLGGSIEIGTADGKKVIPAGEAVVVPAGQTHSHRFLPQSRVLVFRPAPFDEVLRQLHRGARLYESSTPLAVKTGQNYSVRVTEFTVPARASQSITVDVSFGYVVDGTLTVRAGESVTTQEAGKVFALASNVRHVLSNEGTTLLRFILVDLHQ